MKKPESDSNRAFLVITQNLIACSCLFPFWAFQPYFLLD